MVIISGNTLSKNKFSLISDIEDLNKKKFIIFDVLFWKKNKLLLKKSKKSLGIKLNMENCTEFDFKESKNFNLIQIDFSTFKDGRPFTIAKKLKKNFKYKKEIRATGYVLPDQYIFLLRSGFDSVEIKQSQKKTWLSIYKNNLGLYYQK